MQISELSPAASLAQVSGVVWLRGGDGVLEQPRDKGEGERGRLFRRRLACHASSSVSDELESDLMAGISVLLVSYREGGRARGRLERRGGERAVRAGTAVGATGNG